MDDSLDDSSLWRFDRGVSPIDLGGDGNILMLAGVPGACGLFTVRRCRRGGDRNSLLLL